MLMTKEKRVVSTSEIRILDWFMCAHSREQCTEGLWRAGGGITHALLLRLFSLIVPSLS